MFNDPSVSVIVVVTLSGALQTTANVELLSVNVEQANVVPMVSVPEPLRLSTVTVSAEVTAATVALPPLVVAKWLVVPS